MAKKYLQLRQGLCFWCGGLTNELRVFEIDDYMQATDNDPILDIELFDYKPCKLCAAAREGLTIIIEADTVPSSEGQPTIEKGLYPTGRYTSISRAEAKDIVGIDTDVFVTLKSIFTKLIGG